MVHLFICKESFDDKTNTLEPNGPAYDGNFQLIEKLLKRKSTLLGLAAKSRAKFGH